MNNLMNEKKAVSKSQQRLFGMVTAYQNGKLNLNKLDDSLADKIKAIANGTRKKTGDKRKFTKGMNSKATKDLASTKHDELPEKVKESIIIKFDDFGIKEQPILDGGKSDDMTIEDIAKLHNVNIEYLQNILNSAIKIEFEHTNDINIALKIALDHLVESPIYYDENKGLPNMEEELEKVSDEEIAEITNSNIMKFDDFDKKEINDDSEEKNRNKN